MTSLIEMFFIEVMLTGEENLNEACHCSTVLPKTYLWVAGFYI